MALPRKGTRRITVGAHTLRWLVRPHPGRFDLVVERYEAPGQKVIATLPEAVFPAEPRIVSPQIVRQCVEHALSIGFDPAAPSGEVRFTVEPGQLRFDLVHRDALTPRPVGRPRKREPGEKRKPVFVSLDKEDRARLEAAANRRGLRVATLARIWLLERLNAEADDD